VARKAGLGFCTFFALTFPIPRGIANHLAALPPFFPISLWGHFKTHYMSMDDNANSETTCSILEGLATVVVGIASFWMVFDFPDEAHFLSDVDRQRVLRRLKADQQSSAEHESFKMEYFWASVKDWKTWLTALIYMGADCPLYAFSLFLPSIISAVSLGLCYMLIMIRC